MSLARSFVVCLLVSVFSGVASAQYRPAFSTITFQGGLHENTNETLLHQYWSADRGAEFVVTTPLHFGEGEIGGFVHKWRAGSPDVPDFDALLAFAGWAAVFEPIRFVQLHAGVRIGAHRMSFDYDTFKGAQNETEVALGVQTRLRIAPVPWAGMYVGASYMQTYTYVRMKLAYVSFGIHATLKSPQWLRTVLR